MTVDSNLVKIMAQVFNVDENTITMDTVKDDIEEWDSLEHIKLVLEIEDSYKIKFDLDIIPELVTVKKIQEEIERLIK